MKRLLIMLAGTVSLLLGVAFWLTDSESGVAMTAKPAPLQHLLERHTPTFLPVEGVYEINATEADLRQLLVTLVHKYPQWHVTGIDIELLEQKALIRSSVQVGPRYLNVTSLVGIRGDKPELMEVQLADQVLPDWLVNLVLEHTQQTARFEPVWQMYQNIERVRIAPQKAVLAYHWSERMVAALNKQGKDFLFSPADQQRIALYLVAAHKYAEQSKVQREPLPQLFQQLFQLAQQRTQTGESAVDENRALLTALALYHSNLDLSDYKVPKALLKQRKRFYLNKRKDLARHFVLSAAMSLYVGDQLTDSVGLLKEMNDSRNGSGFSFYDLAADRAGIRFARQATKSEAVAKQLQAMMAVSVNEAMLVPAFNKLPEGMTSKQFEAEFKDTKSTGFKQLIHSIDRQIEASPLYRRPNAIAE
ncbi:hypothetical protein [Zooshikella harenae]|uniref:DUF2927 domain-containing protein n=1 Tax=Zooshikella harenae TaxID=2827238 RepID=A0ABS5Z7X9_9GAMM|nr:hypothetical protein [Zooshikella harenae]MBU2709863.1 hypothetical protein [Zooshikella harenae]